MACCRILRVVAANSAYTSCVMKVERYNAAERAREKALSREADARALASGEKTREQLHAENSAFAFPPERVRIDFSRVKIKR